MTEFDAQCQRKTPLQKLLKRKTNVQRFFLLMNNKKALSSWIQTFSLCTQEFHEFLIWIEALTKCRWNGERPDFFRFCWKHSLKSIHLKSSLKYHIFLFKKSLCFSLIKSVLDEILTRQEPFNLWMFTIKMNVNRNHHLVAELIIDFEEIKWK